MTDPAMTFDPRIISMLTLSLEAVEKNEEVSASDISTALGTLTHRETWDLFIQTLVLFAAELVEREEDPQKYVRELADLLQSF